MKPISLFVPFERIERKGDVLEVEGYCFVNEVVEGEGGIRLLRSAMEDATPDYMKFGAVREMHQPMAAGTAVEAIWDEKGCKLLSRCVDPIASRKIEEKVYKGYSVSVVPQIRRGNVVERLRWPETSYVDRPRDPDALFLHRTEGFDPDAEVEVEVLDDVAPPLPSLPAGDDTPPVSPAAGDAAPPGESPAGSVPPDLSALPAEGAPGGSISETEWVAVTDAMRAAGLPADLAERVDIHRALTSTAVPTRENLEKKPKPAPGGDPTVPLDLTRMIKHEGAKWVVYSEGGQKLGEHDTEDEAKKQLQAIEANKKRADEPGDVQRMSEEPMPAKREPRGFGDVMAERAIGKLVDELHAPYMALMDSLYSIMDSDATDKADRVRASIKDYATYLEQMCSGKMKRAEDAASFLALLAPIAEAEWEPVLLRLADPGSITTDVSAQAEAITRAETAEADLTIARRQIEATETRLAVAEGEVKRLLAMPADAKPPVRYPHALKREFLANLGEQGDAETQAMKDQLVAAETAAKVARTESERNRLVDQTMEIRRLLHQRGVTIP